MMKTAEDIGAILAPFVGRTGGLLAGLRAVQHALGHVPAEADAVAANLFNLSRAEVKGVVSFYADFHREPRGEMVIKLCAAEACQAAGGRALQAAVEKKYALKLGETNAAKDLTLEPVYCLGLCSVAPSAMVGETLIGRADAARIDAALQDASHVHPVVPRKSGTLSVYIPLDSAAVSLGADEVATALAREAKAQSLDITVVRTGSRGMHWLEPLVEIERGGRRMGFGPVSVEDVAGLVKVLSDPKVAHPKALGPVEEIPFFKTQTRLTFARCGIIDPLSLDQYRAHGGLAGLGKALTMDGATVCAAILESGLRGRGGAGFPAGIKWKTVAGAAGEKKYIVCNADEGDSGTFADRMIMEGDPFLLIEGMVIAGLAVGAGEGFIYLRAEYPVAERVMKAAIGKAYDARLLGANVLGSGKGFDLEVFMGAGAYICGEETSLLESLEGKRGEVRAKPPLPALEGLFGKPTLVHNVISLCAVPTILAEGAQFYRDYGMGKSTGTMPFQIAGNVKHGGLYETAFGVTVGELVETIGGGTRSGRPVRAVQIGGPLGAYLPQALLNLKMDYETMLANGAGVGHGGLVVFDDTVDLLEQARYAFEFCVEESCGKCTPCRIGSVRGVEVMDRIRDGAERESNLALLEDLCELMDSGSLCAMGGMTPIPVKSALKHFPEDFGLRTPRPAE